MNPSWTELNDRIKKIASFLNIKSVGLRPKHCFIREDKLDPDVKDSVIGLSDTFGIDDLVRVPRRSRTEISAKWNPRQPKRLKVKQWNIRKTGRWIKGQDYSYQELEDVDELNTVINISRIQVRRLLTVLRESMIDEMAEEEHKKDKQVLRTRAAQKVDKLLMVA